MSNAMAVPVRIQYEGGSEHSPGDPWGHHILVIEPAGHARLDLHHRGSHRAWTGTVDGESIVRVLAALATAGFPAVPVHTAPGGGTFRSLALGDGQERASAEIEWYAAKKFPGYKEAFAVLDLIVRQLSEDTVKAVPAAQPPVVTKVERVLG